MRKTSYRSVRRRQDAKFVYFFSFCRRTDTNASNMRIFNHRKCVVMVCPKLNGMDFFLLSAQGFNESSVIVFRMKYVSTVRSSCYRNVVSRAILRIQRLLQSDLHISIATILVVFWRTYARKRISSMSWTQCIMKLRKNIMNRSDLRNMRLIVPFSVVLPIFVCYKAGACVHECASSRTSRQHHFTTNFPS